MQLKLWEEKTGDCCKHFFEADVCNNPKLKVLCICYCQQYFRMRHFTIQLCRRRKTTRDVKSQQIPTSVFWGPVNLSLPLKSFRLPIMQPRATQGLSPDCREKQGGKLTPEHWRALTLTFLYHSYHYQVSCFGRYGNSTQFHTVN